MHARGRLAVLCLAVLCVLTLTGCGGEPDRYAVSYTDASAYVESVAEAALDPCLRLPGVNDAGSAASLPPVRQIDFSGREGARCKFESCLEQLPGVRVHHPPRVG